MAAPAFVKNPRVIIGAIIVLWVAYVLYSNFQLEPVPIHLAPFAKLQVNVSAVVVGSAIFGALVTILIQYIWRRRQSSNRAA